MYTTTSVRLLVDMPYGGKRYKAGKVIDIESRFFRPLSALKKVEAADSPEPVAEPKIEEVAEKPSPKSYKTKDMKAE